MRARICDLLAVAGLFSLCCVCGGAAEVGYFANNGFGNPVASLQHPSAEHYNGKTYVAYQGPQEDPQVCVYDHAAQRWSGPVKAGENPLGRKPSPRDPDAIDNHGRPALIIDGEGYIHLIFGGHGGMTELGENTLGTPGSGKQIHAVSRRPEDITEWEVLDNVSPFGTYSQFVRMDDGDLYLFYRHGSHRSDWVYQKSADNGRTFSEPVSVLKHKQRTDDPNVHDAWYAWFEKGKGDTITVGYVYHRCAIEGHAKDRVNGYFMRMDCGDDSWETIQGEAVQVPVTKEYADAHTLVCDTGTEQCNHGTNRVDSEGNPHLFFRQGSGQLRYYRWSGSAWQGPSVISSGHKGQDGDFVIESPSTVRFLLTQSSDGGGEVGWWETVDGGRTWKKGACLISSPTATFDVDAMVRNGGPQARMVVSEMDERGGDFYRKVYLLSDTGPVPRPQEEADCLALP